MIEVYKVAYVKTTDEPVFVLKFQNDIEGNTIVTVRRPIQSDAGVNHVIDNFLVQELHTREEQIVAEMHLTEFQLDQRDKLAEKRRKASSDVQLPLRDNEGPLLN